jgi:PEP-CTERM motif
MSRILIFVSALSFCALSNLTAHSIAVPIAADDATQPAYLNGWQDGDNGGTGFGRWVFAFSGNNNGLFHDPQFIDRDPLAGNSIGAPSFGLTTGNRASFGDTSEARRNFLAPIRVAQTFSVDVDGSALDLAAPAFTNGNTLQLFGADGQERFGLFTNNQYHGNNWTATGNVNTGIPAGSSFHIDFTLLTANTYNLTILPIGGGVPLFRQLSAALDGAAGSSINSLRVSAYGTGSSENGIKEMFFDNLMITRPGLDGDYNNDGSVDAADYVVWRNTSGQSGVGLAADGNRNNRIDAGDYDVWRANFNPTPHTSVGSDITAVPEPETFLLMTLAIAGVSTRQRWRPWRPISVSRPAKHRLHPVGPSASSLHFQFCLVVS